MKMNFAKYAAAAFIFLFFGGTAFATPTAKFVSVCVDYDISYSTSSSYGDFYSNNSYDPPAYGIYLRIDKVVSDIWVTDWEGYTGTLTGCVTKVLYTETKYRIKAIAKSRSYHDNDTYVKYEDQGSRITHAQWLTTNFYVDPNDSTYTFVHAYNSTWKVSNVLAAAGRSLRFRDAGVEDHEITYLTNDCPDGNYSCNYGDDHDIYLSSGGRDSKFTISHETGHNLLHERIEDLNNGWKNNCVHSSQSCPASGSANHSWYSQEYQSCAAMEGFANFYAAAVWNINNGLGSDCYYGTYDCLLYQTYMEDYCDTPWGDKGVEADWTIFLWHLHSQLLDEEDNLSVAQIARFYAESDPEDWTEGTVIEKLYQWAVFELELINYANFRNKANLSGVWY
jgi:hypothetical protein